MNVILYLLKTGCQWRMIPKVFAPWESVYYYFSKWKYMGIMRTTFIFDENGTLTEIIEKVDTKNHAGQILK